MSQNMVLMKKLKKFWTIWILNISKLSSFVADDEAK
jgi:hypothetical protein